MKIPFIRYSKIWLIISGVIAIVCIALVATWGLKLGIDFTGGSLMELNFVKSAPKVEEINKVLAAQNLHGSIVQNAGEKSVIIRSEFLTEAQHQGVLAELKKNFASPENEISESRFETIGSSVSRQLRQRALWAIIFVNLGIIGYVAYAFRKVSRPVASYKYGLLAIVALIHDVFLVLGVFAVLGRYWSVEIDIGFVVAVLTVLGYSVNDTIVVYDRIRENLLHHSAVEFAEMVNNGLNETLMRSINTTLTTLLPLFALYFVGGESIHNFALALLIGIASGAYSSIFIASPLLVLVEKRQRRTMARG